MAANAGRSVVVRLEGGRCISAVARTASMIAEPAAVSVFYVEAAFAYVSDQAYSCCVGALRASVLCIILGTSDVMAQPNVSGNVRVFISAEHKVFSLDFSE